MCTQCEQLRINGVVCHETGCPEAWRDEIRECRECGTEFTPAARHIAFCCKGCLTSHYGMDCPEQDEFDPCE